MMVLPRECTREGVGAKAYQLAQLLNAGFCVPAFVVITDGQATEAELERCISELGEGEYAVRSSASGEDGLLSSMAGQFETRLQVKKEQLLNAIAEVYAENNKRAPQMRHALIVQKMVPAEKAGVVFTRSPLDPFCLQIDTVEGLGDALVSGKANADTIFLSRRVQQQVIEWQRELAEKSLEIEELCGLPQDIEWCLHEGRVYVVQSRPISTWDTEEVMALESYEEQLPTISYSWVKNGYSELLEGAEPFMVELIRSLFMDGGPVQRAYASLGISMYPLDPVRILGTHVYYDESIDTRITTGLFGWWKQWKLTNAHSFYQKSLDELKQKLQATLTIPKNVSEALALVRAEYEVVFRANLIATSLLLKANGGKRLGVYEAQAITSNELLHPPINLMGNSFSVYDKTLFHPAIIQVAETDEMLSVAEQYGLAESRANALREYGRWYALRLIALLKPFAPPPVQKKELVALPRLLSTKQIRTQDIVVLVEGEARGMVSGNIVDAEILSVKMLTPDLASVLTQVRGILCEIGSPLSHMAILAREANVPVYRLPRAMPELAGSKIEMRNGEIQRLE